MTVHVLDHDQSAPRAVTVSDAHFGVNTVTIYDQELADPHGEMTQFVGHLGATVLRFPGGSATEYYFDMTNPNADISPDPSAPALLPMDQFMQSAAAIGVGISLVVPTRIAFTQTAADAMHAGTYGARHTLDPDYLENVSDYVEAAIQTAVAAGTDIQVIEIGNEFWGSGEMTAAEYGHVAAHVAVTLDALLTDLGRQDIDIIAQATSSASEIYSPKEDTAYSNPDAALSGADPDPVVVSGQGDAADQLRDLTTAINAISGAADSIDGAVLHFYHGDGFSEVDAGRDFTFFQLNKFSELLNRSTDASDMSFHITEWNAATTASAHNAGLQQASMMVEIFYEMVSNGVNAAQIWPLSFNAAQGTSLLDMNDNRLAIAGEMFRLMSESLPGLKPVLDLETSDGLDLHGFAKSGRASIFVSERSGEAQSNIALDTSLLIDDTKVFVTVTTLWDEGAGGQSADAKPSVTYSHGKVFRPDQVTLDLPDWANARVELTSVSWRDDKVAGRAGDDRIFSYGGDDQVSGGAGDDYIHGGKGNDALWGSAGDDTLVGGLGVDLLTGGSGADDFVLAADQSTDIVKDFTFGHDKLRTPEKSHSNFSEADLTQQGHHLHAEFDGGIEVLIHDKMLVTAIEDDRRTLGSSRSDVMLGSDGGDDLRGYNGADHLLDGAGRDYLRGGNGADLFVLVQDGDWDRVTDFEWGKDKLDLGAWDVSGLDDLVFDIVAASETGTPGFVNIRHGNEILRLDGLTRDFVDGVTFHDILL